MYFQKADENANFIRIKELYDALYIEKYSKHNIRFCASYIQKMVKNHLIELYLLKEKDEILGCVGFLENQTSLTAPIIGYDTKSKKPLYRTLQAFMLEQAKIKNKFLNESSGASTFKLLRKMQSNFEYSFIYTKHLSFSRRLCFKILSIISIYFYGKILKNFKL